MMLYTELQFKQYILSICIIFLYHFLITPIDEAMVVTLMDGLL